MSQPNEISKTKQGWMVKKGQNYKTWHKRYFVIKDDILLYFKDSTDLFHPLGVMYLQGGIIDADPIYKKRDNTFIIRSQGKRYQLQAENPEAKANWIKALEEVIRESNEKKQTGQELKAIIEQKNKKIQALSQETTKVENVLREVKATLQKFKSVLKMNSEKLGINDRKSANYSSTNYNNTQITDPEEKIKILKTHLQEALVELKEIYSMYEAQMAVYKKRAQAYEELEMLKEALRQLETVRQDLKSSVLLMQLDVQKRAKLIQENVQKISESYKRDLLDRLGESGQENQKQEGSSGSSETEDKESHIELELKAKIAQLERENRNLSEEVKCIRAENVRMEEEIHTLNTHKRILIKEVKLLRSGRKKQQQTAPT